MRFVEGLSLRHKAELGGEQGGIDLPNALQGPSVDDQVGQGIQVAHRVNIAHFRPFDAQVFALAIDAFGTGALGVDGLVERTLPIQGHAHLPAQFPVQVLDTAFLFEELGMVARLSAGLRKEQWAAKALRQVAVGMGELVGGVHAQPFGTQRHSVSGPLAFRMPMLVLGDGGDATAVDHHLIGVPGIEGSIGGDVSGKEAQGGHGAQVERDEIGDIVFIER